MRDSEIKSWIFLAIDLASQNSPAGIKEISQIADGINHAVPTNHELYDSIKWLLNKEFIYQIDSKFTLTKLGIKTIALSKNKSTHLLQIWKDLQNQIETNSDFSLK
jgi:hypothetical protein